MRLTIQLSVQLETKLREQAAMTGQSLEAFVLEAIDDKLAVSDPPPCSVSFDEWQRQFQEWLATMPMGNPNADLGRDSIYEGRGL